MVAVRVHRFQNSHPTALQETTCRHPTDNQKVSELDPCLIEVARMMTNNLPQGYLRRVQMPHQW